MSELKLGVNIDHVATLRQQRKGFYPDPTEMAAMAAMSGAWGITAHLREDRRHIQDADMFRLAQTVKRLNMEMAVTDEMVERALEIKPHSCCLVPEKRQELTTEGGLDVLGNKQKIANAIFQLKKAGIVVSLFIDPDFDQIRAAQDVGANYIELHTGAYAKLTEIPPDLPDDDESQAFGDEAQKELDRLIEAARYAHKLALNVNAGHGIDYENMRGILKIPFLCELNIGFSIVSRALVVGFPEAIKEMKCLIATYKNN